MQDINMPLVGKASEFSLGKTDLHGNWRTNLSTVTDHMQLDSHYSNRECTFGDTNIFSNIRRREDTSDGKYQFFLVLVIFFLNHNSYCSFHTLQQLVIKIFRNPFTYISLIVLKVEFVLFICISFINFD